MRKALLILALMAAAAPAAVHSQPPQAPGRGGPPPAAAPPAPPPPLSGEVLKIRQGQVQGFVTGDVAVFRGLPFAAPPVGDLRWREPRPAANWTGVRPANAYGGACNAVEDCLYLNVFTRAGAKPSAKMPVIFWMHGGGFAGGSGAGTDGTTFVRKGVIVVSTNYRLGRAGWFAHPAIDAEPGLHGNYGLMDQIAGLKWVRDNIAAFGGDPNNVTIAGGSAGAVSVNYLMLAPQARGLFHKAISESGFGRSSTLPISGPGATAEALGVAFAERNKITGSGPEAAKALRALSLADLRAAAGGVGAPDQPKPMADGKMITGPAVQGFAQKKQAKIPYLLGGNSDEGSLFRATANVPTRMAQYKNEPQFLPLFDYGKTGNPDLTVAHLISDETIAEPTRALARLHSAQGHPTFVYHFSYVAPASRGTGYGAGHGSETAYVFNQPRAGTAFDAESQAVANAFNNAWAAFAKTGNPGAAAGTAWPKYSVASEPLLEFSGASAPAVRNHFDAPRLDWVEARVGK